MIDDPAGEDLKQIMQAEEERDALRAEVEALRAKHARLRAALEPFVRWEEVLKGHPYIVDSWELGRVGLCESPTVADLRAAANALKETR